MNSTSTHFPAPVNMDSWYMMGVIQIPNWRQILTICAISLKNTLTALVKNPIPRASSEAARE